ncbi:hypothetical protein F5X68DRAFT_263668 [Plectosphaerella plurivora]|uniref:Protamine P1 n=1 Tax=Plectosphaerella plurivora TaxID=936078 RepID=A0A9P8V6U6_9PEZI|nr:hypothetical protein F5X68DRAFT_263668 [Plectosphaerella plurivora]
MSRKWRQARHRLADEPIYCEAEPAEIIHKNLSESTYGSCLERQAAYERAAVRFLNGSTLPLLTSRLRGPFDSTWKNPWAYKEPKPEPASSIIPPASETETKHPVSSPPAPVSIASRTGADKQSTTCHLPSPVSLDHKMYEVGHDYLDEEELARVEDWRSSVTHRRQQADAVWTPPRPPNSSLKRRANTSDWLKGTQNKRRKTRQISHAGDMDQLSVVADGKNTSPVVPMPSSDPMDEDEIQAHVKPDAPNTCVETPSRRSPPRTGFQRSPVRELDAIESDDELSKPSESAKKPSIWKAASARSQVSRRRSAVSPQSSPSRRFLRAKTTTPGTDKVLRVTDTKDATAEFETQQDDSFIFRAKKKNLPQPHPTSTSTELPPGLRPFDGAISDITSPGRAQLPTAVSGSHVLVPDSPYKLPSAGEQVYGPRNATPESDIIPTSQPLLDAKALSSKSSSFKHPSSPPPQKEDNSSELSELESGEVDELVLMMTPTKSSSNRAVIVQEEPCVEAGSEPHASCEVINTDDDIQASTEKDRHDLIEAAQAMVDFSNQEEEAEQSPALPATDLDQGMPDAMEETFFSPETTPATTQRDEPATTESQQTPWHAPMALDPPTPSDDDELEDPQSQLSDCPAFSQAVEPVRTESQQTPWYLEAKYSPPPQLLISANPSPLGSTGTPDTQRSWSHSLHRMQTAAQLALYAVTRRASLSHQLDDQVPDNLPEESASVASVETPSLHTAPTTPIREGPDPVFEDASSPRDGQASASPKDTPCETGFVLKPFAAFRSPSPELRVSQTRKRGISHGVGSRTRSILVTRDTSCTTHAKKQVSWVLLDDHSKEPNSSRSGRSATTTTRLRAPSPPPDQALADLPTGEKDPFRKHFSAIKMKAKGHRHRILPSASQQVWRSPSPTAVANAFIMADELAKNSRDDEAPTEAPVKAPVEASPVAVTPEEGESFDDVDEVLRNLGDFLNMVDVDADVEKAKADMSAEKTSQQVPMMAG